MRSFAILGLLLSMILIHGNTVFASDFGKKDLAAMSDVINKAQFMVLAIGDNRGIDILNAPMSEAQLTKFGVYFVAAYDEVNAKFISDGKPIKLMPDMEPFTSYTLVSIKSAVKVVEKIFGYKLNISENFTGQIHGFTVSGGNFILAPGDAGADIPIVAVSAKRDGYGLIRVRCEQENPENEKKKYLYRAVLKEHIVDGQKCWQVLLVQPRSSAVTSQ